MTWQLKFCDECDLLLSDCVCGIPLDLLADVVRDLDLLDGGAA